MRLLIGASVALSTLVLIAYSYLYATNRLQPSLPIATQQIVRVVENKTPEYLEGKSDPFPQEARVVGVSVYISSDSGLASGVVIDRQTILTVAHVVGNQKMVMVNVGKYNERRWVPANVVGKLRASGEDIIILQIVGDEEGFYNKRNFKIGTGIALPRWIVTPSGVFDWNPGAIVPGDSGSAVLNIEGDLIGLVTGYITKNKKGVVTLFKAE